jgi:hypothetical protein
MNDWKHISSIKSTEQMENDPLFIRLIDPYYFIIIWLNAKGMGLYYGTTNEIIVGYLKDRGIPEGFDLL